MIEWKYLSEEEQKKWLESWNHNWCWAKWSWIRPPHWIFFETSCNIHDYWYTYWETDKDRKKADKWLLKYMKLDVKRLSWYRRPKYYIWCYIYYIWLRLFWWKAFYNK